MRVLLFAVVLLCIASAQRVREKRFGELSPGTSNNEVVVFYDSAAYDGTDIVTVMEEVAARLEGTMKINFWKCDFQNHESAMSAAGLTSFPQIFISVEGFSRYREELTADAIYNYIQFAVTPVYTNDVYAFSSEQILLSISQQIPVFVKFFEPWCMHSKAVKKHFQLTATKHKPAVQLVEVDCQQSAGKAFCLKLGLKEYPTFKLFYKGQTIDYDYSEGYWKGFDSFLAKYSGGHTEL